MEHKGINLTLKVWRQANSKEKGTFVTYEVKDVSTEVSFLEMFDVLNEKLIREGQDPIAFDHDCREGICGSCSMYINGRPHGPWHATTVCQLHMRAFNNGDTVV
ncbi:MAG TPA: 2Fe-2S iron-sulfur cluster-binding protein, partial [Flavitalea sp.]|nr:2Fe-2S iron-sulfur cluster-binding protein [Flavitalea sp.]